MSKKITVDYALNRGVEEILPSKKGLSSLMDKKKITLYQGFDPSMPSLHLGNLVGLIKLKHFQELGHKVIFLVGDFTGMIGDPTDKSATRKKLTRSEVLKNAEKWKDQASRVLDFEGENPAEIKFNSKWNDKVSFKDLIEITSHFSVQRLLERDMFEKRIKSGKPIRLHEFLYPVAQAVDSLEMDVDLEIGGSDQVFNMLAGRSLMKSVKGKEKYVLSTKLLTDSKGDKVGKTTGNALFLDSKPQEFYSGIMSFPDETLLDSFELLTDIDLEQIKKEIKDDPMQAKKKLAYTIVNRLWGEKDAIGAQLHFENTFQKGKVPDNITEKHISESPIALLDLVWEAGVVTSRSQIKRLIADGAIEIDGKKYTNPVEEINIDNPVVVKIGKIIYVKISLI